MGVLRRRGGASRAGRPARAVVLVTRQGCHLCEQAAPVVAREAARAGASYAERDVDADEADRAAYGEKVPVVLVDGVEHAYWHVDERALRAALSARS